MQLHDDEAWAERAVGRQIAGKYMLTRLLGCGGMGAVYEAQHEFTKRRVAVKLMHAGLASSQIFADRFLREAQAPGSIGHPGIVQVLDGGRSDDGALYLVLELLEGETLSQAMSSGKLSESELGAITLELLDALSAAHAAGFVHRDIKPDNLFLVPTQDGTPRVKLLDFGVAGVLAGLEQGPALTQAGTVLGTPLYMSPEQALGKSVDGRSDLWSVGALMYQALAGEPPFFGESVQALIVSIATQQHAPLGVLRPEVSLRMAAVVERALRKNLGQRWQSADEMAAALRAALTQPARPLPPVSETPRLAATPPKASRSIVPIVAALALLTLSAAAGIGLVRSRRGPRHERATAAAARLPQRPSAMTTGEPARAGNHDNAKPLGDQPATNVSASTLKAPTDAPSTSAQRDDPNAQPALPKDSTKRAPRTVDAVTRVLGEHQAELRRCYEDAVVPLLMKASEGAPSATQPKPCKLDVSLRIAQDGSVQAVDLHGDAPEIMRPCAEHAIRAWRFPSGDAATEISFPVVFQPSVIDG